MHGPSQYQVTIHRRFIHGRSAGAYLSQQRIAPDGRVFTLGFSESCALAVATAMAKQLALPIEIVREDLS